MRRSISILLSLIMTATIFSACDGNSSEMNQDYVSETTTATDNDLQTKAKSIFEESFKSHGFKGAGYLVYKGEEIYSGGADKANKKEDIDNSAQENRDAIRTWIYSQNLLFKQGERYSYSNSNYFLLGEIIELASKKSYFDNLKTNSLSRLT